MTGEAGAEETTLGPYRIEQELGRGFSSVVYQAFDTGRGRRVALKILTFLQSLDDARRTDLAERFARESRAISALSHPNIVAIYDVGQAEDGRQFIAMERLAGETLRRRLQRDGRMSVSQAVAVAVRIADALHYAHGRGIVHRDVKPDNVFLCEGAGDEGVIPKLMDFGIAHVLADQGLTQDGTIVGSPAYMSPEQINGHGMDARTDVFSLAVTLAEMVSGAKPFEAETVPAVMQRILHHAPDLKAVPDGALRRVLARALSKSPQARYPDAEAFALALRQAVPLAGLSPTVATQILVDAPPSRKFTIAGRMPSAAALGLGGLALATLAVLPLLTPRSNPPASPTERAPTSSHVHRIAAVWQPARPPMPDLPAWRVVERIAPPPTRVQRIAVAQTPLQAQPATPAVKPPPPSAPNPASRPASLPQADGPAHALRAKPLVASTPAGGRTMPATTAPPPIVRVAASRQEMTLDPKPAPATPEVADAMADAAAADVPPAPRETDMADAGPRVVHRTVPALPPGARVTDGAVTRVRVSVDEDGAVTNVTLERSSGNPALDQAAIDCVRQWEYDPAIRDGQSTSGKVTEQVKFDAR